MDKCRINTYAEIEEMCHCCPLQVLIPERQMSEGLLEVLSQRSDLSLYRSALLVSVQSCRPAAPQMTITVLCI